MVASILDCDIDGNTNSKKELVMVKGCLTTGTAVESVKKVQVCTFVEPKTIYRNISNPFIYQSIDSMRNEMNKAQTKPDANIQALQDEIEKPQTKAEAHTCMCKKNTQEFQEPIQILTQEANLINLLRNITLDIRTWKCFLAISRHDIMKDKQTPTDQIIIQASS